ncbi:hypothetical protein BDM02DRAFT_1976579 [Thelephora ganbajun]|uniref:Uncharacterized protein n=1 Tax=Thelephora ganbajun TaxID=370292 RepID=A0ACB6YZU2_THEGA|nr:hypothetical protein BDM02DRAFT_1976579 [Thelephora ganbajun]
MRAANFTVSALHGKVMRRERDVIVTDFRSGNSPVVITTDVWPRGIYIQQVSRDEIRFAFVRVLCNYALEDFNLTRLPPCIQKSCKLHSPRWSKSTWEEGCHYQRECSPFQSSKLCLRAATRDLREPVELVRPA